MTGLNKITLAQFMQGLRLLADVYGGSHAVFTNETVQTIWFRFFENYTITKFQRVIEYYIGHSQWFPKSPHEIAKLWDESGEQERLAQLELSKTPALPAANEQEFTEEQLIQNQKKLKLAIALVWGAGVKTAKIDLAQISPEELNAIYANAKKAKLAEKSKVILQSNGQLKVADSALISDIRKYFHSGSERYRQMAIDWVSDPSSGCEFIRNKNGQIVDIKEVDF